MTKKLTTDYGALEDTMRPHMRPLNRDAFNAVIIPREDQYKPRVTIAQAHWDAPPDTKPLPRNTPDLTGLSFGRFKVMGYLGSVGGKTAGAAWLVRCSCGKYEHRRTKSIKNPNNTADACAECKHVMTLMKGDRWRRTGRDQSYEDFI